MNWLVNAWNSAKAAFDSWLQSPKVQVVLDRLKQQSTWRGIGALMSVIGIGVSDENLDHYYQAFLAGLALLAIFNNEPKVAK